MMDTLVAHWIGWAGNIFLILGLFLIGRKWRHSFLLTSIGESLWLWESWRIEREDMVILCGVFLILALWNWWQWGRDVVVSTPCQHWWELEWDRSYFLSCGWCGERRPLR